MEIKGIDVSAYTGAINYSETAGSGIKFAILRITERGNILDPTFESNYRGFRDNKVKVGVYKFSYALSEDEAREEARKVLEVLKGRELEFPVFYDLEWSRQRTLPTDMITKIVKAFRKVIVDGGYLFGIYCNTDWYYHVLDTASLPYEYWRAAYPYNDRGILIESLRPPVGVGWQYSSKGQVPGIQGYVDLDVFYKDYSEDRPDHDKEKYKIYTVKAGDTLSAIAEKFDTTVKKLAKINHIEDVNLIFVGQKLKVPVKKPVYKVWVGECTANGVNVRRGAGIAYAPIKGYPYLNAGNLVDVIGEKRAKDKVLWYHVLIANKYKGYVRHDFIKRV